MWKSLEEPMKDVNMNNYLTSSHKITPVWLARRYNIFIEHTTNTYCGRDLTWGLLFWSRSCIYVTSKLLFIVCSFAFVISVNLLWRSFYHSIDNICLIQDFAYGWMRPSQITCYKFYSFTIFSFFSSSKGVSSICLTITRHGFSSDSARGSL